MYAHLHKSINTNACIHTHYQTDKLAVGIRIRNTRDTESNGHFTVKNAVVSSYGAKKQKKRTETATHLWNRKHFIESLYYRRRSKLRLEVFRQT